MSHNHPNFTAPKCSLFFKLSKISPSMILAWDSRTESYSHSKYCKLWFFLLIFALALPGSFSSALVVLQWSHYKPEQKVISSIFLPGTVFVTAGGLIMFQHSEEIVLGFACTYEVHLATAGMAISTQRT